jgi:hypothetical protein
MYAKMPFGLMNAGETFQRAMDIAFIREKDKFVVIYLDDITVFSRSDKEHCGHLRKKKLAYMNVPQGVVKVVFSLSSGMTDI